MRLRFLGASGEVTGSCYLLETRRARVLIDFGAFQGGDASEARNRQFPSAIEPGRLDAVLLTHAHIDHTGRLPLLAQHEFARPIYATPATIDLAAILLRDAAYLQRMDAQRESRKRVARGEPPVRPLFDGNDVDDVLPLLRPVEYQTPTEVAPGVEATWVDAGHILGSASIHLRVREPAEKGHAASDRTIVFSGDIGPRGAPLLRDPTPPTRADVIVLESTYGDRDHRPPEATLDELASILTDAMAHNSKPAGNVVIPAFAVGRTQNLVYHMGILRRDGRVPEPEVWIDSPMAIKATELYRRNRGDFDAEARAIIDAGDSCLHFPGLHFSRDRETSMWLNTRQGLVVISASGMCNGGRIVHHLRHNLSKPESHVLIVGFQAQGTTGRAIVDGASEVRILGEVMPVRARVHTLNGFSAHAGRGDLLWWMSRLESRPKVFLTHGEDGPRERLASGLKERFGIAAALPRYNEAVEI
ncbi:MAG: MBL fold metallo-hydrolase [Phycisphaeraceae bacterium]|nr:MBL fold metallo-hydrolase [Phycisphaeraceae bacterium]